MKSKELPAAYHRSLSPYKSPVRLQTGVICVLLFACFIVLIAKPEGCHCISLGGASPRFLGGNPVSFAQLSAAAHVEASLKDAKQALKKDVVEDEELINLEGAAKPLNDGDQHKTSTQTPRAEDKSLLPLKPTTVEKPPEQLGEKELLQMPFGGGVRALLSQSKSLLSLLQTGLIGSQALDEAAKLSTKLRGDIVKDVEALSHTLEQEHANLSVLRRYEREQDALLKAQLGYLLPIAPTPAIENLEAMKSVADCVRASTTAALLCAAFFLLA
ncbi:hypothetical protein ACSSS7_001871 [Eimeria intestinalis]